MAGLCMFLLISVCFVALHVPNAVAVASDGTWLRQAVLLPVRDFY